MTINELALSSTKAGGNGPVSGPLREVVIQGNMIKHIEESLTKRYMVPQKYIETTNKLPEKKKRQR